MKHIKEGVQAKDLQLVTVDAMLISQLVLHKYGYTLVVTSLSDSKHKDTSLHYQGYAVDIRSRDMRVVDLPQVCKELRVALGNGYQVVQESDHIHIEWDPQ